MRHYNVKDTHKFCPASYHQGERLMPLDSFGNRSGARVGKQGKQAYCIACARAVALKAAQSRRTKVQAERDPYLNKADSLPKTAVRASCYARLSRHDFLTKKHIVIIGACGDIRMLLAHGVPVENIIACDTSAACRKLARGFAGITLPETHDIIDTVAWAFQAYGANAIGSINLDTCGTLLTVLPIVQEVRQIASTYRYRGALWAVYQRGREAGGDRKLERSACVRL